MKLDLYWKNNKLLSLITVFLQLLSGMLGLSFSFVIGNCIDEIFYSNNFNQSILYACIWLLVYGFVVFIAEFVLNITLKKITINIKRDFINNIKIQSASNIYAHDKSEYITAFSNLIDAYVNQKYFLTFKIVFYALNSSIIGILVFTYIDYRSLFLLAIIIATSYLIPKLYENKVKKLMAEQITRKNQFLSKLIHNLEGFHIVKYYNAKNFAISEQIKVLNEYEDVLFKQTYLEAFSVNISILIGYSITIIMLIYAVILFNNNLISIGYIYIFSSIISKISTLARSISNLKTANIRSKQIENNINKLISKPFHDGKSINQIELIELAIDSFGYNDKTIFSNKTFTFEKNKKYLIQGPNGSGKTTIIRMLLGCFPQYLKVNGLQINEINERDYLNKISYLSQSPIIISGDIEYNIKLNNTLKEISLFDIVNINRLLKANKAELSEGQKQQLVLLRSISKNSDVLILDEPLNNLDINSQKEIINYLASLQDQTIIVIEHTTDNAFINIFDEIIDLNCKKGDEEING